MTQWKEKVLAKFIKLHGNLKVDEMNNLGEEDFKHIYDLIECFGRLDLNKLRTKNEKLRGKSFSDAFFNSSQDSNQKYATLEQYINQVTHDI
mmetsp:Transcript_17913/g.30468  ORF Transcript_17913/g.30468 Transcript_17913/m.30468 type:complete len:92 (+) Transcript_17913:239-514(+)